MRPGVRSGFSSHKGNLTSIKAVETGARKKWGFGATVCGERKGPIRALGFGTLEISSSSRMFVCYARACTPLMTRQGNAEVQRRHIFIHSHNKPRSPFDSARRRRHFHRCKYWILSQVASLHPSHVWNTYTLYIRGRYRHLWHTHTRVKGDVPWTRFDNGNNKVCSVPLLTMPALYCLACVFAISRQQTGHLRRWHQLATSSCPRVRQWEISESFKKKTTKKTFPRINFLRGLHWWGWGGGGGVGGGC